MIQAIVFDFDGVLADSEPVHLAAVQDVLSPMGFSLTAEEYYSRYLGLDDEGLFRALAKDRGLALDDQRVATLIEQKAELFDRRMAGGEMLFPGAAACIERLARTFPLGIASGSLRHEIEHILAASGLRHHFRFIVASGDTPNSKPHPDPYRRAAELHELAPGACVAIEDSRWGIEAAKNAGLWCVGIATTYARDELLGADAIIDALDQFTTGLIEELAARAR